MSTVTPLNYHIEIEPDLEAFTFSARTRVRLTTPEPVREILLNALELTVHGCRLKTSGGSAECRHELDAATETLRIRLPEKTAGDMELDIAYQGVINDRMAGFYRSRYGSEDRPRYLAVTQFEESDARRAFPCMDNPKAKAGFDIELIVPSHLTAVSNADIAQETPEAGGKKRVRFHRTPRMSTYLVFFGVGEFEITRDAVDGRVRVFTLPGMSEFGRYGLVFGRKALAFCEAYFGIPYPLSKLDLIAIPDFAFGAMENWGAVTFRENLLLHYPDMTSRLGEARICEVIAHEIAHQWFGNLVTPSDWKYLWLNESFATYFGYGVVDHYAPQWGTWDQFLQGATREALHRDALRDTCSIEIPGGEHVVINTGTAPIIYSKGGSILRQAAGYMGEPDFQRGLRHYLKRHAYDCAESHHLWEALEAVSDKPITRLMKSWIGQPGHPLIKAGRDPVDTGRLVLEQHRFTFLEGTYDQHWMVPVAIGLYDDRGSRRSVDTLLEAGRTTVDLDAGVWAYKINSGQTGFYRVWYDDAENLARLGRLAADGKLCAEDRWGLTQDLFALVKGGRVPLPAYLDFLNHYRGEDAFLPLLGISGDLFGLLPVLAPDRRGGVSALVLSLAERTLDRLGYAPLPEEAHTSAILRDLLLWEAAACGSSPASDFTAGMFSALVKGKPVHPDIQRSVLQAAAHHGDGRTFDRFVDRVRGAASEHDRMNLLTAMGCFRNPEQIEAVQAYLLTEVPDRNRFVPVASLCQNPHAAPLMWEWFVANIHLLEASHPLLYERIVASVVPVCGLEDPEGVKTFLGEYVRRHPKLADVMSLSLERLEINLRLRSGALSGSGKAACGK